ncbi:MAG: flagellar hook-length control protein FliK [Caulobacter sp.]|nr:flagellar hook-length control protein FliK [Caulobacter sp.]
MTIFPVNPLTSLTPPNPVNRTELGADALARVALIQATETLGGMIGQSNSDGPQLGLNSAKNDAELEGAVKGGDAVRATSRSSAPETPSQAVAVAAGKAAARQGGMAPLMADMAQAAAAPQTPAVVKAAIGQVMALRGQMDGQISAPEIRQALQRSGLFLEARLAATAQGDPARRQAMGTLTAPPRVVPTPTPNSDMKAALLVFREVVKTWLDKTPAPPLPSNVQATQPSALPNAAATSAALATALSDRGAPQAMAAATASPLSAEPLQPPRMVAVEQPPPAGDQPVARPASASSAAATLPAFGAIVADDLPLAPGLTPGELRAPIAAAAAYGAPTAPSAGPTETPPPYAGAPTHAQAAAQPGLPPGSDAHTVAHRLLSETEAALARTELLQIASLPEPMSAARPSEGQGARWVFDMPFMTPQGPAAAQFEISRDGGGGAGSGDGRALGRTWRARFSLDVEPMGPVHAHVALTGDRARVSLWAERPASMARLRGGEERLNSALREAALEPEVAFHAGQPHAPAAAPGQFLDRAT